MTRLAMLSWGWGALLLVGTLVNCSSQGAGGGNGGSSVTASGGAAGSGGTSATGGSVASGGTTSSAGGSGGASSPGNGGSGGGAGGTTITGGTTSSAGGSGGATTSRDAGAGGGAGGSATGGTGAGVTGGDAPPATGGAAGSTGGTNTGGTANTGGGNSTGGGTGTGGATSSGGSTGNPDAGAAAVVTCPDLPGAEKSTLYSVTVGGTPLFVEKLSKFSPEMQVHYTHASLTGGTATVAVTVSGGFNSYKLSPKSRQLPATKNGDTLTFTTGPNYLIFQPDTKELLFILLDAAEDNPPKLGDANVKNLADYTVDNTGGTLVTSKIQSAINAASGATQNILYVPPGKYKVGELSLKSNMTLYLACGAILYGSGSTGDFNTVSGGINIEGMQHALIRIYQAKNTKLLGRGVLDSNGKAIRAAGLNASLLKIEQSSSIVVDGIVSRDSSYWNTLIYRSDQVTIQNYKVINCRPTSGGTAYNQTDGVDFDESTNGKLYNAFLYTGDDGMATKNEEPSGTVNTKNIVHEHVVVYNNSVGGKIGTKSMGQTMDGVVWRDIDVVKAGRAMTIEAYDTAVVSNTTYENVRVEAADSMLINIALDQPPDWRDAANTSVVKDTYFTNVSSDVKQVISLHGKSSSVNINGVHFKNLTVQGKAVTSQTDPDASWSINSYVSNITFE
jgi:hypothetical protein